MLGCTCLISDVAGDELGSMRARRSLGDPLARPIHKSTEKPSGKGWDQTNALMVLANSFNSFNGREGKTAEESWDLKIYSEVIWF